MDFHFTTALGAPCVVASCALAPDPGFNGVTIGEDSRVSQILAISPDGSAIGGTVRGSDGQNQAFGAVVAGGASILPLLLTTGFRRPAEDE